jgi:hypothetical protein
MTCQVLAEINTMKFYLIRHFNGKEIQIRLDATDLTREYH